jgi:uncharacterized protein (TIGR01777 family)
MRVLVTGSSGLIGTALTEALTARGDTCVSLVRPASSAHHDHSVQWDPGAGTIDQDALDALGGVDAAVNLAGVGIADKRWTPERKHEILTSRLQATSTLVRALRRLPQPPTVLVSASAIGFYGDRGDEVLDESASSGSGFLAEVCVRWEEEAAPLASAGVRVVTARTGIVLTRRGGALAKQLPLFKAGLGGRLGPGSQWTSWISLHDEIAALLWAIDHPELEGPVNLVAPHPVTNMDFTTALAAALHRPAWFAVPAPALKVALGAELVDEALLSSARVSPGALLDAGFSFRDDQLDAALPSILG